MTYSKKEYKKSRKRGFNRKKIKIKVEREKIEIKGKPKKAIKDNEWYGDTLTLDNTWPNKKQKTHFEYLGKT